MSSRREVYHNQPDIDTLVRELPSLLSNLHSVDTPEYYTLQYMSDRGVFHTRLNLISAAIEHPHLIPLLLTVEPNVDLVDRNGNSALMLYDSREISIQLLQAGADDRVKNRQGLQFADEALVQQYALPTSPLTMEQLTHAIQQGYYRLVKRHACKLHQYSSDEFYLHLIHTVTHNHHRTLRVLLGSDYAQDWQPAELVHYMTYLLLKAYHAHVPECLPWLLQFSTHVHADELWSTCVDWPHFMETLAQHHILPSFKPVYGVDIDIINNYTRRQYLLQCDWTPEYRLQHGTLATTAQLNQLRHHVTTEYSSNRLPASNRIAIFVNGEQRWETGCHNTADYTAGYTVMANLLWILSTMDLNCLDFKYQLKVNNRELNLWNLPNTYMGPVVTKSTYKKYKRRLQQYNVGAVCVKLPVLDADMYRFYFCAQLEQFMQGVTAAHARFGTHLDLSLLLRGKN